ncbi:MAG: hypothetical protein P4L73_05985 [Caulobacteraceae bacterium]|nr:hypothetical protein [Caulobacteraceae bacterium]
MTTVISKLQVPDYGRWAEQFEAGAKSREDFGVEVLSYGYDASDHNIAIVILRVENEAKGEQLLENPILQKNLQDEGIKVLEVTVIEQ